MVKEQSTAKYGVITRRELNELFDGFEGDYSSDEDEAPKQLVVEQEEEVKEMEAEEKADDIR